MIARTPLDAMTAATIPGLTTNIPTGTDIEQEQLRLLRNLIEYTQKNSPYYRDKLKDIEPEFIKSRQDIQKLPFTTKDDIRMHNSEMLCVSNDDIARIVTIKSSGTTGKPKRLYFTEEDIRLTFNFFSGGMMTMVDPGDKVVILLPGDTPDSTGDILKKALEAKNVSARTFGLAPDPYATIKILEDEKPQCIVGFPVQLFAASRVDTEKKIPAENIKSLLLCSDYIPDVIVNELESAWNCENFIHYGTVETGLGGGVECSAHCGTHLRETDLLFEIVNPLTGEPLPYGTEGEIAVTTLTRKGMPLIRYRTGDIAAMYNETCPCGSSLRRLSKVSGRFENKLKLESGSQLSLSMLDESIFKIPGVVDFDIEISDTDGSESIKIEANTVRGFENSCAPKIRENLASLNIFGSTEIKINCKPAGCVNPAKRIIKDNRQGSKK
jgi:phenylacetate-coenzyme A ligase PaaK-like adenylate-forming protein